MKVAVNASFSILIITFSGVVSGFKLMNSDLIGWVVSPPLMQEFAVACHYVNDDILLWGFQDETLLCVCVFKHFFGTVQMLLAHHIKLG